MNFPKKKHSNFSKLKYTIFAFWLVFNHHSSYSQDCIAFAEDNKPSFLTSTRIPIGGENIFINTSQTNANINYEWLFGDGVSSSLENPKHTYYIQGQHVVSLKIYDPFCEVTYSKKITALNSGPGSLIPLNTELTNTNTNPIIYNEFKDSLQSFLNYSVSLKDDSSNNLSVYLSISLISDSLTILSNSKKSYFNLNTEDTIKIKSKHIAKLFADTNTTSSGHLASIFNTTKLLPEGNYELCIHVNDSSSNKLINESCNNFTVKKYDAPTLNSTSCNQVLPLLSPLNISLNWDKATFNNSDTNILSQVTLLKVKIDSFNLSFEDALLKNYIDTVFQSDWLKTTNSFIYDQNQPELDSNERFLFTVQNKHLIYPKLFNNEGISETCNFYYGYPINGTISLARLADNAQLSSNSSNIYFDWSGPNNDLTALDQKLKYKITIKEVNDNQTPEDAMLNNTIWEQELTNSSSNGLGSGYLLSQQPEHSTKYVWMVESISEDYVTATSELRVFNGPVFLSSFYVEQYIIRVSSVSNYDFSNLSGEGYVVINDNQDEAIVSFNNISLTSVAGRKYLNSGEVLGEFPSNFRKIPINTGNSNKNINYLADSVKFTRESGLESKGQFEWIISGIAKENDTVYSEKNWTIYNNYDISGLINIQEEKTIKELNNLPLDYELKILQGSHFKIINNNDESEFLGEINNGDQSVNLTFTLSKNDSIKYFDLNTNGNISVLQDDSLAIDFNIKRGYVDFSNNISFSNTNQWKGIELDSIETVFSKNLNFTKPNFTFNKKHIDSLGVQISLVNTTKDTCKFKGYPSTIDSLKFNVKNSLIETNNYISGIIDVPYISNDSLFNYNYSINENDVIENINQKPNNFEFDAFNAKIKNFNISHNSNIYYGEINHSNNSITLMIDSSLSNISSSFNISGVAVDDMNTGKNQLRNKTLNNYNLNSTKFLNVYSSDSSIISTYSLSVLLNNTTSIEEVTMNQINIYPNPTSDLISIDINQRYNKIEIKLINLNGQVQMKSETNKIDISLLNSGIYYLYITLDNNKTIIQKIIKK